MFISYKKLFMQSILAKKKGLKASYLSANFDVLLKPPQVLRLGNKRIERSVESVEPDMIPISKEDHRMKLL